MSPEIICSIVTGLGAICSALISYWVSSSVSKREIQKLRLTWDREDSLEFDKGLQELFQLVYEFIDSQNDSFAIPAISRLAPLRAKETGPAAPLLDELHIALDSHNRHRCRILLSDIVIKYREAKSDTQNKNRKQPKKK